MFELIHPNNNKFKFTHEEYSKYVSTVEEASFLFQDLEKNSEEIFSIFDESLFSTEFKLSIHEKVKKESRKLHETLNRAKCFLSTISESSCVENGISMFKPNLIKEIESYLNTAIDDLEKVIKLYNEGIELAGNKFDEKNYLQDLKFQLLSIFSNKNKRIYLAKKTLPALVNKVHNLLPKFEKFNFDGLHVLKFEEFKSLKDMSKDIQNILSELKEIEAKIKKIKSFGSEIEKIELEINQIKTNRIFDFNLPSYIDLENYQSLLEFYTVLECKVRKLKEHIDSYGSFHNWKYFCKDKENFTMEIFNVLKNYSTTEWKNIFIACYYRGALLNYDDQSTTGFNKSDTKLQQLTSIYKDLKKQQVKQIKSLWTGKKLEKLSKIPFNFNTLYNLRKNNAGPKNSLRKIIEKDFDLFTSIFPVVLTNPIAANAIFPLKQGLFNIVIFDEASQLRIPDTFTSLIRGQYKIIAGDEHQMPPSNYFQSRTEIFDADENDDNEDTEEESNVLAEAESLLQYASDLKNINKSYLDFHYRSNHPSLIEFSNCAFYGGNLISFPSQEVYKPIDFRAVNGRYETRTNPAEIAEILKIIDTEIHPDLNGKYPSIGIATFNINQRNLIIEALNQSAENNPKFATKLQELRERGLFVKNLENIQGDERDIVIISTTYGIKPNGTFSQNFARLNRIEGYKLLNVLITRAKHKVYVCTSIPKEKYLSYDEIIKNEGNNKKGILYAYLAYAEAISQNNTELAENILKTLKSQSFEKPRAISNSEGLSESPFEEEVYELLKEHFEKENIIQQHKIGGFRLDFLIRSKTKDIVLECDGKSYHASDEAYAYDMYRQKELENMGFTVYRIWSTNWFQDKEVEMKKLLIFIENLQTKFN